jgi:lysophospholipase L1-like esterase
LTGHPNRFWSPTELPAAPSSSTNRFYVRFVALGDSATLGPGDGAEDGTERGWAEILVDAISEAHDLSYCNVAVPGSTITDVWSAQLPEAIRHRAHLASLIVGLNDVTRASWEAAALRTHLLLCATALTSRGATLMTVRFHEHARVMRLPRPLAEVVTSRLEDLNEILDEVHQIYGGVRLDLAELPEVYEPRFWTADRRHPSEFGHRVLAANFATLLRRHGLPFAAPELDGTGADPGQADTTRWVPGNVVPWLVRRARELGPAAAAVRGLRLRLGPNGAS